MLTDPEIDRLSSLLEQRAVPHRGLGLEALDGFFSALAVSPVDVSDAEWQAVVWGGRPPRWDDDAEAAEVARLLAAHRALALQRACHDDDDRVPDRLSPLLWLPEDPEAPQDDALDVGADWADGFLRGVALREDAWTAWFEAEPWIDEIAMLMDRLASGEVVDEDPTSPAAALDYRERLDIIASLPGMLADLQRHRIDALTSRVPRAVAPAPERNAPCPCGSGRKYKKCCGG